MTYDSILTAAVTLASAHLPGFSLVDREHDRATDKPLPNEAPLLLFALELADSNQLSFGNPAIYEDDWRLLAHVQTFDAPAEGTETDFLGLVQTVKDLFQNTPHFAGMANTSQTLLVQVAEGPGAIKQRFLHHIRRGLTAERHAQLAIRIIETYRRVA